MTEKAHYEMTDYIDRLIPMFEALMGGESYHRSEGETRMAKTLLGTNVLFLRTYLGFVTKGEPYEQKEFAALLGLSSAGLRKWENGEVIPNELSLRAVVLLANQVLKTPQTIEVGHLLCKNLVTEMALLRMGSHSPVFQDLPGFTSSTRTSSCVSALPLSGIDAASTASASITFSVPI